MTFGKTIITLLATAVLLPSRVMAETAEEFEARLSFKSGAIEIGEGIAN